MISSAVEDNCTLQYRLSTTRHGWHGHLILSFLLSISWRMDAPLVRDSFFGNLSPGRAGTRCDNVAESKLKSDSIDCSSKINPSSPVLLFKLVLFHSILGNLCLQTCPCFEYGSSCRVLGLSFQLFFKMMATDRSMTEVLSCLIIFYLKVKWAWNSSKETSKLVCRGIPFWPSTVSIHHSWIVLSMYRLFRSDSLSGQLQSQTKKFW